MREHLNIRMYLKMDISKKSVILLLNDNTSILIRRQKSEMPTLEMRGSSPLQPPVERVCPDLWPPPFNSYLNSCEQHLIRPSLDRYVWRSHPPLSYNTAVWLDAQRWMECPRCAFVSETVFISFSVCTHCIHKSTWFNVSSVLWRQIHSEP